MKKSDILILLILFGLWFAWGPIDRHLLRPMFPPKERPAVQQPAPGEEPALPEGSLPREAPAGEIVPLGEPRPAASPSEIPEVVAPRDAAVPEEASRTEEFAELANESIRLRFTSRGAGIVDVRLNNYRERNADESGPVDLVFAERTALAYSGLPGFSEGASHFDLEVSEDGRSLTATAAPGNGLRLQRSITLSEGYSLRVVDTFFNEAAQAVQLPEARLQFGPMRDLPDEQTMVGVIPLGVDSSSPGEKVERWERRFKKMFEDTRETGVQVMNRTVDWVAVKNRYFVQSLIPVDGAPNFSVLGRWDAAAKRADLVSASLIFEPIPLMAGSGFTREYTYYVGPKKLSELKKLGHHQERVMDLGYWFIPAISALLLSALNFLQSLPPYSYGLSIILLTLIVRILFWPLTHRGTESMRRMQEFAPQMKEINEKHKDNPQKRQEELMKFYRENKINPLGGCLPMLVQLPVFIGLFFVLRSAIELRFASFLWIDDLSGPDQLITWKASLPFIGHSLNILPLLMSLTMYIQQKVTPMAGGGDPKQMEMQKMMMRIMPIMMLFFLYHFASGLALYWTTQNLLMIVQQLVYKKRKQMKEAHAAA